MVTFCGMTSPTVFRSTTPTTESTSTASSSPSKKPTPRRCWCSTAWRAVATRSSRSATGWPTLGYRAVAVDLFGRAATVAGPDACAAAMASLIEDREMMRDRLIGVVEISRPCERPARRDGGHRILLRRALHARSGAATARTWPPSPASTASSPRCRDRPTTPISTKVTVFHGWDDPFAPPPRCSRSPPS